jgi:hypothetical protein
LEVDDDDDIVDDDAVDEDAVDDDADEDAKQEDKGRNFPSSLNFFIIEL